MKTTILLLALAGSVLFQILNPRSVSAQNWQWAKSYGGGGADKVGGLAVIQDGGVFLTGSYTETVSIGTNKFKSKGEDDVFLLRTDGGGELRWAISFGGGSADFSRGCATDDQKNVFVVGTFADLAKIGNQWLTGAGGSDLFLAKFDENGTSLWTRQAGGAGSDEPKMMVRDTDGNLVIAGVFSSPEFVFDHSSLQNRGQGDIFLAKYNPEGTALWAIDAGGTEDDFGTAVATDAQQNIYVTGGFRGTAWFGTNSLTSATGASFLAKFDSHGSNLWAVSCHSDLGLFSTGLAATPDGRTFQAGYFLGNATFGDQTLSSSGISDIFLAAYDTRGVVQQVQRAGGASMDQPSFVTVDPSGAPCLTGFIFGKANFGTNEVGLLLQSAFVTQYGPDGTPDWIALPTDGLSSEGKFLAFDPPDHVFLAGEYSGTINLDGTILTSAGARDVFLTRLSLPTGCQPVHLARPLSLRKIDARSFEITAEVSPGGTFELQYSSDLKVWAPLTNFQAVSTAFTMTDQVAPPTTYRFYRNIQTCQ
jgi:hypothetical protein